MCGATGVSTMSRDSGCRIGPPADSEYAVLPVAVATISASQRWIASREPSTATST